MSKREVDVSDLQKVEEALHAAYLHFLHRDEMNGHIHLAKKTIQSPITTLCQRAWERTRSMIDGPGCAFIPEGQ